MTFFDSDSSTRMVDAVKRRTRLFFELRTETCEFAVLGAILEPIALDLNERHAALNMTSKGECTPRVQSRLADLGCDSTGARIRSLLERICPDIDANRVRRAKQEDLSSPSRRFTHKATANRRDSASNSELLYGIRHIIDMASGWNLFKVHLGGMAG